MPYFKRMITFNFWKYTEILSAREFKNKFDN